MTEGDMSDVTNPASAVKGTAEQGQAVIDAFLLGWHVAELFHVLTLPPHPRMSGFDAIFESRDNFGALGAQTMLDAAHASEVALVVADLGSPTHTGAPRWSAAS